MIIQKLEVKPFAVNCYLVGEETSRAGIIIDPGGEAETILKKVETLSLNIKSIVLTHAHIDHIGALKEVKEATKAEIAIHTDDAHALQLCNPFELKGGGINQLILEYAASGADFGFSFTPPPPPDRLLKDGDSLDLGPQRFLVLHTPGHSPGGICLLGEDVVFTGDTLFNSGIGRTDLPGGNSDELMDSIHTRLMVLPDNTIVYPGHGPESTIGQERQYNLSRRGY